ncbi:intraflagellar transport protein 25 homolog isoform X4 [Prionailurus iriomotensis]
MTQFSFIVTLHLHIGLCPVTTRSRRKIKHFKMKKIDLCLSSEGAEVILATSSDEKHPPENMIDGPWIERDLVHTEGQLQNEEITKAFRIGIEKGRDAKIGC